MPGLRHDDRFWRRAAAAAAATTVGLGLALALAAAGCGGDSGGDAPTGPPVQTSGPYQPLTVGAHWVYAVNDANGNYTKHSTVEAMEDVGGTRAGTMGARVREGLAVGDQLTWYVADGDVVTRIHEQNFDTGGQPFSEDWYDPGFLRVDSSAAHMAAGATYSETYTDHHMSQSSGSASLAQTNTWKVEAVDEVVSVPAGTFKALRLRRIHTDDNTYKTYWFTPGVGKIREQGESLHREELTEYGGT